MSSNKLWTLVQIIPLNKSKLELWRLSLQELNENEQWFVTSHIFHYLPYFCSSHSRLSSGQTCLVFNHRDMQWKWKAWLQTPQATVHSSLVTDAWFAWHSIHKSIMWFLQMAQLSTTISHAHKATAFHFLTSNRFFSVFTEAPELEGVTSCISTSPSPIINPAYIE